MFRISPAILALLLASSTAAAKDRDTIVLVLFDALRHDHVGIYGYDRPTTPNLDGLAREGTRYTRAYVNAPWTRPSTASYLTGYYASRHRTETEKSKLAESVTTLAERLKAEGYMTAGFTANGNGGSLANLQKGFDVFEDPSMTYTREMRGKTYCCNGLPTGEFLVKRASEWLNSDKSKKRFIFLFFVDPHDPYGAPPELERMFLGKDFVGEPRRRALWETNNDYPPNERFSLMALYDAGIHYADKALGQFLDLLKKNRLYDEATIMVTSDHGEGFGEHNFYLHAHHFWEEIIHVPLVIRGPGVSANQIDDRITQGVDVATTIATVAGADTGDMDGVSLLAAPHKGAVAISEYNEFGIHRQAIVGERYKVIWQRPADEEWYMRTARKPEYFPSVSFDKEVIRVFNVKDDPFETKDLAQTMPTEAAALLERLRQHVAESDKRAATHAP